MRNSDWSADVCSSDLSTKEWNDAAFNFHQAAERAYICFLLVRTLYFPRSHNIKFLRSLAEDIEARLISAWPRGTRAERRLFALLKRAYVEASYSDEIGRASCRERCVGTWKCRGSQDP